MVLEDEVRSDLRLRLTSGDEVLLQKTAEGVVGTPETKDAAAFSDGEELRHVGERPRPTGRLGHRGTAIPVTPCP